MKIIKNPDQKIYEEVSKAIEENEGYCPCKLEKNKDTKCICTQFKEQKDGECECGRFIKIDDEVEIKVPGVKISTIKKIISKAEEAGFTDEDTVEFVYLIGSCFPNVYQNIMNTISNEYMRGFKEGFGNGRNFTS